MRIQTFSKIGKRMGYMLGVVAATMVGGLATVIVSAAIPDSNGVIHGCYSSLGTLRVIDSPSQSCTGLETAISWDQNAAAPTNVLLPVQPGDSLNNVPLVYRDMSNSDLSDTYMNTPNLTGSDLSGVTLDGATIQYGGGDQVNFSGTDFTSIELFGGPAFSHSDFSNTVWTDMTLGDTGSGCIYGTTNIVLSNLSGSQFDNTALSCFNFSESNMTNVNFAGASLTNVSLQDATMTGANITGTAWDNVTCPDGTNSDNNGNTCAGHL